MSVRNGVYASGAGKDEAEIRRRNVQSYEKANGEGVYKFEAEDTKKTQKVCPRSGEKKENQKQCRISAWRPFAASPSITNKFLNSHNQAFWNCWTNGSS